MTAVRVEVAWARPSDIAPGRLPDLLDASERERLDAYRSVDAAHRYLVGHALTRIVLAERLDVDPEAVEYRRTCATCGADGHGKPVIDGVEFSQSSARDRVVIAVSGGPPIGVDVESRTALAALGGGPDWTLRESALKALGVGLAGEVPEGLRRTASDLDLGDDYAATLTVLGDGPPAVTVSDWTARLAAAAASCE